ncbi:MAG: hypothetical protein CMJ78_20995 [Planctomycetaceae bacterium]|nr:hypothetical protein [Planctomycetaceae bacterium]
MAAEWIRRLGRPVHATVSRRTFDKAGFPVDVRADELQPKLGSEAQDSQIGGKPSKSAFL